MAVCFLFGSNFKDGSNVLHEIVYIAKVGK